MTDWKIFRGNCEPHNSIDTLIAKGAPPWRTFGDVPDTPFIPPKDERLQQRMSNPQIKYFYQVGSKEIDIINTALYLRRPLLVTGKPGSGKSSLADAIAYELNLGRVLRWPITSRSTLQEALYRYDAIGRLQEANLAKESSSGNGIRRSRKESTAEDIGRFISLGPLGTALLPTLRPQVLLIDEIDKSDLDLPNDLLNIFEEGWYEIPELTRHTQQIVDVRAYDSEILVPITKGRVKCASFPIVILTSNNERELPQAFLRRCLRLDIFDPTEQKLQQILNVHFAEDAVSEPARQKIITDFVARCNDGQLLSNDQLLNAVFLLSQGIDLNQKITDEQQLIDAVLRNLSSHGKR